MYRYVKAGGGASWRPSRLWLSLPYIISLLNINFGPLKNKICLHIAILAQATSGADEIGPT
jgi:hypothetical protein